MDVTIYSICNQPTEHKRAAFRHTMNRTVWLLITHKAKRTEYKIVTLMGDNNVYHLQKTTDRTTTQKDDRSENKHEHKWAKFTCFRNHMSIRILKTIFRNLGLRIAYILDNTTTQNLTIHSKKQEQFHSSSAHELKCNTCNHKYTGQTSRRFTDT
jgi:hypothetical protein